MNISKEWRRSGTWVLVLSWDFTFDEPIKSVVNKVVKNIGFIIRNSSSFDTLNTRKVLFFAFVRSIVESQLVVWSPYQIYHFDRLERVQNRFLHHAARCSSIRFDCFSHDYSPLRSMFKIPTVRQRFLYADILLLYNRLSTIVV